MVGLVNFDFRRQFGFIVRLLQQHFVVLVEPVVPIFLVFETDG
jgi:hypothetical protein